MRCSDIGHDTDSYDTVVITLQKLALFLVRIFDLLSLVYRFILSRDLEILVLATISFHAICNVFQYNPCTELILSNNL